MPEPSSRRPYRSRIREDGAARTRAAIVSAARTLFVRDGYAGTSWDAVAELAGVSRPTVVSAFGTKAALLSRVLDESLAGNDEPGAVRDRPWFQPVWDATTPEQTLEAYAQVCTLIGRRAADVVEALHRAADSSPQIDALWEKWLAGRRAGAAMVVAHPPLEQGLSLGHDRAVDVLWTLNNPDLYRTLVTRAAWEEDHFTTWLAETMRTTLLG
jgi:AcrR family transcriptional regulator